MLFFQSDCGKILISTGTKLDSAYDSLIFLFRCMPEESILVISLFPFLCKMRSGCVTGIKCLYHHGETLVPSWSWMCTSFTV